MMPAVHRFVPEHRTRFRIAGMLCIVFVCVMPLQAQGIWETFSNDYPSNCLAWTRDNSNPVIAPSGSTWKSRWTADPDLFRMADRLLLYYRGTGLVPGKGKVYHDRIGVAEIQGIGAMQLSFRYLNNGSPVIDIGAEGAFDDQDVREPAAVWFKEKVYLYYTGLGKGQTSIGLATSPNGEHFLKAGKVLDGRAPDVIVLHDTLYMFYQKLDSNGYSIQLAISLDGQKFFPLGTKPVLAGVPMHWDAKSLTTPRVWSSGEWFYMMYGGSADALDEPEYFGLARSRDLLRWERHPGNPIFAAGAHATADGGTIRFPAFYDAGSWFVLLYEGSRGKHTWDLSSGICIAWIPKR